MGKARCSQRRAELQRVGNTVRRTPSYAASERTHIAGAVLLRDLARFEAHDADCAVWQHYHRLIMCICE